MNHLEKRNHQFIKKYILQIFEQIYFLKIAYKTSSVSNQIHLN